MELEDISSARDGEETSSAFSVAAAVESIRTYGVSVIRGALDPTHIAGLLVNANEHGQGVENAARSGSNLTFGKLHAFVPNALAVNLTALDPITAIHQVNDVTRTTLYSAIMATAVRDLLKAVLGPKAGWATARSRVVIPRTDGVNGRLALHSERTTFPFPGLHLLWMPLGPAGTLTNFDSPGIEFYIGELEYFETASSSEISRYLSALIMRTMNGNDESDRLGFFYRPKMAVGDLVIFSGAVPHASFMPSSAWSRRDSCEMRVFPWTAKNYMPAAAISNGQRQSILY
jgi:hypothetical protein